MHKLNNKIVKFEVVTTEDSDPVIQEVHESLKRPEYLIGSTYKVKPSTSDHALYITINDVILNEGTKYQKQIPYELFISCKNMDNYQWISALTRLISAVFRKGGDITFLVDELLGIFDPKGGYFKKGGVFMPSLVAEIGYAIKEHMHRIGYLERDNLDESTREFIDSKREELGLKDLDAFPPSAKVCSKCNTKALVLLDGCATCLNCGDSKCG